jgi:hypothetical protein
MERKQSNDQLEIHPNIVFAFHNKRGLDKERLKYREEKGGDLYFGPCCDSRFKIDRPFRSRNLSATLRHLEESRVSKTQGVTLVDLIFGRF